MGQILCVKKVPFRKSGHIYKELRMGGSKQKKYSLFAKQAQVFYIY